MTGGLNATEMIRLAKLGRRAEQRGKAVEGCITSLIGSTALAFLQGWFFMLGVAVLSEHWWHQLPTISYRWSVLAVILLRGTLSQVRSEKDGVR